MHSVRVSACVSCHVGLLAAKAPSLKTQIRELYKRIHPDKFHGFPPARDANEKSFKMLQEYLTAGWLVKHAVCKSLGVESTVTDFWSASVTNVCAAQPAALSTAFAAKEGDQNTAALPYQFVFYLHQAPAQQDTSQPSNARTVPSPAASHTDNVPDGLHKVSLTLPPPARKDYAQPDQLPAATQASIGKLLSACGLQRYAILLHCPARASLFSHQQIQPSLLRRKCRFCLLGRNICIWTTC